MWKFVAGVILLIVVLAPIHSHRLEKSLDTNGEVYWPAYWGSESPPGYAIRDQIVLNSSFLRHQSPRPLDLAAWSTPPRWNSGEAVAGSIIVTRLDRPLLVSVVWSTIRRRAYHESLSHEECEVLQNEMLSRLEEEFPVRSNEFFVVIFFPLRGAYSDWFRFQLNDIARASKYKIGSGDERPSNAIEDCPSVTIDHASAPFICLLSFRIDSGSTNPVGNIAIPIEYQIRNNEGFVNWISDAAASEVVVRVDRSSAQVVDLIASQFVRDRIYLDIVEPHFESIGAVYGAEAANLVRDIAVGLITTFITRRVSVLR